MFNFYCDDQMKRSFLGCFAELRIAAVHFVMPDCPPARVEQLGSHWTDFHEIWYLSIFRSGNCMEESTRSVFSS
jgi:hypothetical protein